MSQALSIWMNGELVGVWSVDRSVHTFRYEASWLDSPHCRSLSLSLPITSSLVNKGKIVENYFDNLLPDNVNIRKRLSKKFNAKADIFGLLQAIGRDCVGAVQLLPVDTAPGVIQTVSCDPLSNHDIDHLLQSLPSDTIAPRGDDELFRISIAGAQEKTALVRWNGQWCRPQGSTPTTHIFKLPLGVISMTGTRVDASDSVYNEWACAHILRALGLPTANTSIEDFGSGAILLVERFDRELMDKGTWIARLPQEDFCQALGLPPDKKYESDGGPDMSKCLQLLQGSSDKNDRLLFLLTQLAFFLLAAPDGHAKNFSIFLQRGDEYTMTPLYDVISAWPYIGTGANQLSPHKAGMAMAVRSKNKHYHFKDIQTRHWYGLAMKHGGVEVWEAMLLLAERVDAALQYVEAILPADFPPKSWEMIKAGMRLETQRFLAGPLV